MRNIRFVFCLLLIVSALQLSAQVSQIAVKVEGKGYTKKLFEEGGLLWNNRTYPVESFAAPHPFAGFEYLQNAASVAEGGTITPLADGYVYLIAKESEGPARLGAEWTVVAGSGFNYNANGVIAPLVVFQHVAVANTPISIPLAIGFTGVTPIAKTIDLRVPLVTAITIDGVNLTTFNEAIFTYKHYLPYTSTTAPAVEITPNSADVNSVISQATNISGTEAERTATIDVTAQDNTKKTYKVIFEQLPELDLFLCIGQSNMAGRDAPDASQGDYIPVNNAYLYATSAFVDAVNPFNSFSNVESVTQGVSPAFSFSKKISANVGTKSGFVVNAKGGSDLIEWDDKTDNLYAQTMIRALEAKKWGTYKAILWHQGEADANATDLPSYPAQLTNLVAHLREDLGDANLFFVAGQIGKWRTDFDAFNAMIPTISTFISNSACALSDGLTDKGDNLHFSRASQVILGERYADIVLKNIYGLSALSNTEDENTLNIYVIKNKLYLDFPDESIVYNVCIADLSGRMIYAGESHQSIELTLYPGVYVVAVKNNNQSPIVRKIVISSSLL